MEQSQFLLSGIIQDNSFMSEHESNMDLSSYSLNTTVNYQMTEEPKSPLNKTVSFDFSSRKLKAPQRREQTTLFLSKSTNNKKDLIDSDHALSKQANDDKASCLFMSPLSFRNNIQRIRNENDKLRSDISRFRGKLEVSLYTLSFAIINVTAIPL
jgi:hypothetical protein